MSFSIQFNFPILLILFAGICFYFHILLHPLLYCWKQCMTGWLVLLCMPLFPGEPQLRLKHPTPPDYVTKFRWMCDQINVAHGHIICWNTKAFLTHRESTTHAKTLLQKFRFVINSGNVLEHTEKLKRCKNTTYTRTPKSDKCKQSVNWILLHMGNMISLSSNSSSHRSQVLWTSLFCNRMCVKCQIEARWGMSWLLQFD